MKNKYPETFEELFKGTGITPEVDKEGNTHYNFTAKGLTFDELIEIAQRNVEEMDKRDKTGLSFVDIMKPTQWLKNLLMWKAQKDSLNNEK